MRLSARWTDRLASLSWVVVTAGVGALAWLWGTSAPRGFPLAAPRFWMSQVAPVLLGLYSISGLGLAALGRPALRPLALAMPASLGAFAVVSWFLFPESTRTLAWAPLGLAAIAGLLYLPLRSRSVGRWCLAFGATVGALAGGALAAGQGAPVPDTRPCAERLPEIAADALANPPEVIELGDSVRVLPHEAGLIELSCGGLSLQVSPLLELHDYSPDGWWTLAGIAPPFEPLADRWSAQEGRASVGFSGAIARTLEVERLPAGALRAEAHARLERPVHAHLSSFASLLVAGHRKLAVAFSPCPTPIAFGPVGYPSGPPQRQAFLETSGAFRVTEASDAEKGPFHTLAAGRLERGEPLSLTLIDSGREACRITFEDWSAQAGTQLSPTAGWGLPVNAIELAADADEGGTASIILALASTSVGRGWDSVGHAAGVYRNRMRIEPLR